MSTTAAIIDNAEYHANLLRSISELEYVPTALKQQAEYLAGLVTQLTETEKKVKALGKETKKQRKEHEDLRDSVARKFAYRVTGKKDKFAEKASKEEREYVEALELEMRERKNQEMLEQMITEGKQVEADLAEKNKKFTSFKSELDDLYHNIFDGTTTEFPRDDELENQLASAQSVHDHIQTQLNTESQALNLLTRADQVMDRAIYHVNQALVASQWDMYGGSSMADMMERDSLAAAGGCAGQVKTLLEQARRISSNVQGIDHAQFPQISLLGDVFFDNFFSDYAAHQKIETYASKLRQVHSQLKVQVSAGVQRTRAFGHDLNEASEVLEQSRRDLNTFRRETFFSVNSPGNASPPQYALPSGPPPPSSYAPPSGPPPPSSYVPPSGHPPPSSHASPSGLPPPSSYAPPSSYVPPPGPPPTAGDASPSNPFSSSHAPPPGPPPPDMPIPIPATSRWGSRNPYAALLAGEKL